MLPHFMRLGRRWPRPAASIAPSKGAAGDSGATVIQNYGAGGIGATAGFNVQDGMFVYGLEGDVSWMSGERSTDRYYGEWTTSIDALATLRGRVGNHGECEPQGRVPLHQHRLGSDQLRRRR